MFQVSKADGKLRDGIMFYAIHLLDLSLHFSSPVPDQKQVITFIISPLCHVGVPQHKQ